MFEYTKDWFSKYEQYVASIIDHHKPSDILEIGSFEGRSTVFMVLKASEFKPIEITTIDTWEGGQEHKDIDFQAIETRFDSNIRQARALAANNVRHVKVKEPTNKSLPKLLALEKRFDLIYIDGSHEAPNVLFDVVCSFELLRPGGFLIADDYKWSSMPAGTEDLFSMPKIALDAFVNCNFRNLDLIEYPLNQLYLRKR
jgi:predicted O-methyltransferase YrrM